MSQFRQVVLASSVLVALAPGASAQEAEEADWDVQEAALLWAFENAETTLSPPAAYCVGVNDGLVIGDPSPAFIERFAGSEVPVRAASECELKGVEAISFDPTADPIVADRASGRPAILFDFGAVIRPGESSAEMLVHYLQSLTLGSGWRCELRTNDDGIWQVSSCEVDVQP